LVAIGITTSLTATRCQIDSNSAATMLIRNGIFPSSTVDRIGSTASNKEVIARSPSKRIGCSRIATIRVNRAKDQVIRRTRATSVHCLCRNFAAASGYLGCDPNVVDRRLQQ
jgi:hypothetical protein